MNKLEIKVIICRNILHVIRFSEPNRIYVTRNNRCPEIYRNKLVFTFWRMVKHYYKRNTI